MNWSDYALYNEIWRRQSRVLIGLLQEILSRVRTDLTYGHVAIQARGGFRYIAMGLAADRLEVALWIHIAKHLVPGFQPDTLINAPRRNPQISMQNAIDSLAAGILNVDDQFDSGWSSMAVRYSTVSGRPGYQRGLRIQMLKEWLFGLLDDPADMPTDDELINDVDARRTIPARRDILVTGIGDIVGGSPLLIFDPTACNVPELAESDDTEDGGGDTFDCYKEQELAPNIALNAGTGFDGFWILGDNPFGFAFEDDFESYQTGDTQAMTLAAGNGFDGPWITGDGPATHEIELIGSSYRAHEVTDTQTFPVPNPQGTVNGLLLLCLMRRDTITSGLDGWTLVAEQKAPDGSFSQWSAIYQRPLDGAPDSVTITLNSSQRFAGGILLLASQSGNEIQLQGTAEGQYAAPATNPGFHPVQSLVSGGAGRYGVALTSCIYANTSGSTTYELLPPWIQIGQSSSEQNRMCLAVRPLANGQNINSDEPTSRHATSPHEGAEISAIFHT